MDGNIMADAINLMLDEIADDLRWLIYEVIDNNKTGQTIHIAKRMYTKYFGEK